MQDNGEYAARVRQEYTDRSARVMTFGVRDHPFYSPADFAGKVYWAAEWGELDAVAAALVRDPSIDVNGIHVESTMWHSYETPLHAAARRGHTDVACLLIALGADIDADSAAREGLNSPLHEAVRRDRSIDFPRPISAEMVRLLLDSGADANRRYFERQDGPGMDDGPACNLVVKRDDIIHPDALRTNLEVIDLLIGHGLDVNMMPAWSSARPRPFSYLALQHGGLNMLKWAVSRGATVSDSDFDAFGRENTERGESRYEVEDYFIERGFQDSDLKILANFTFGPGVRSKEDFLGLVGLLLTNLPEPAFEQMPRVLAEAVKRSDLNLVEFWLDWGVEVNAWHEDGSTLLLLAVSSHRLGCRAKNLDIIRLLLERGAEANAIDERSGGNALHLAVLNSASGHLDMLPLLLAGGVDPDAKNANGDTPLLAAVRRAVEEPNERDRLIDCIHVLAKAAKNINATDALGRTALHMLARRSEDLPRFQRIAIILLQQGIRADTRDNLGFTAGDLFQKEFSVELGLYRALSGQL